MEVSDLETNSTSNLKDKLPAESSNTIPIDTNVKVELPADSSSTASIDSNVKDELPAEMAPVDTNVKDEPLAEMAAIDTNVKDELLADSCSSMAPVDTIEPLNIELVGPMEDNPSHPPLSTKEEMAAIAAFKFEMLPSLEEEKIQLKESTAETSVEVREFV